MNMTMTTASTSSATSAPDVLALLAQADLLLLLADGLHPPTRLDAPALAGIEPDDLATLLGRADFRAPDELAAALARVLGAWRGMDRQAWSDEYHRLFEGSMLCPLNETAYIRRDKGAVLGDVCAFYRAFGWQGDAASGEKPDHLVCELEFAAMLLVMAACAAQRDEEQNRDAALDALGKFASAHLNDWLEPVRDWLRRRATAPFYVALADAIAPLWSALAARHGWPDPAPDRAAQPADEPQDPYECPAPGWLDQGVVPLTLGQTHTAGADTA